MRITGDNLDHDCNTPQGQACQGCAEIFNGVVGGPKVVYKESTKTKDQIKLELSTYALKMADEPGRIERLIIAKIMLELIDEL